LNNERIADLFIDQGLMDRAQADDVLLETIQNGKAIEQAMVDNGIVDEAQFYRAIADALGTEVVDLDAIEVYSAHPSAHPSRPGPFHRALPIGEADNAIRVALVDPLDTQTIEDLRFALGRDIEVVLAPSLQIEERCEALRRRHSSMEDILKQLGEAGELMTLADKVDRGQHAKRKRTPPDHSLRRSDSVSGDPGPGERHPFRAVRERIQSPLSGGWRAL
jgi:type IV pilus assembly protein PilB